MTIPVYSDPLVDVYLGDNCAVMAELPAESVDLIVTSPPYNVALNYSGFKDEMAWPDYYAWMGRVLDGCYRVLRKGGTIAWNVPGNVKWIADHEHAKTYFGFDETYKTHRNGEQTLGRARMEPIGFRMMQMMIDRDDHIREPIVWVKGENDEAFASGSKTGCDSDPMLRNCHELILLGSKGQWFHRGGTGRRGKDACPYLDYLKDVWILPPEKTRDHPAPFPPDIPYRLMKIFLHGADNVVLDPFCGSGTTNAVAKQLGYRNIGIDCSPEYARMAASRCSQELLPLGT